jgi:hypothetical protein
MDSSQIHMNFIVTLDQQPFYIGKILPINNLNFKNQMILQVFNCQKWQNKNDQIYISTWFPNV